jgi:superfamily II DNA or RNA helicase
MSDAYERFLAGKQRLFAGTGIEVSAGALHPALFPFQRDLTRWALRKGRAAIFADTGLGKTWMQLEWARHVPGNVLILAPLVVAQQTVHEAAKLGIAAEYRRAPGDAKITVTNYEMVEHFDPYHYAGIVLDESSILKSQDGVYRKTLTERFAETPFRLCCTATPAPNDVQEFANHSEFLGILPRVELLATFFVHDDNGWRLKRHAVEAFYRWTASWGMAISKPSDLGYSDDGYILPSLEILPSIVETAYVPEGQLFASGLKGVSDRAKVRHGTKDARIERAADLIGADPSEQWIAWCGLNEESIALTARIPDAVEVTGSMEPEEKAERITAFIRGDYRVMVSKVRLAGFGLNLQNAARQVFVGLSDSYEQYYQAIRRSWRFGQRKNVKAWVVLSDLESPIYDNVLRKEAEARRAQAELIRHAVAYEKAEIGAVRQRDPYEPSKEMVLPEWLIRQEECVA